MLLKRIDGPSVPPHAATPSLEDLAARSTFLAVACHLAQSSSRGRNQGGRDRRSSHQLLAHSSASQSSQALRPSPTHHDGVGPPSCRVVEDHGCNPIDAPVTDSSTRSDASHSQREHRLWVPEIPSDGPQLDFHWTEPADKTALWRCPSSTSPLSDCSSCSGSPMAGKRSSLSKSSCSATRSPSCAARSHAPRCARRIERCWPD